MVVRQILHRAAPLRHPYASVTAVGAAGRGAAVHAVGGFVATVPAATLRAGPACEMLATGLTALDPGIFGTARDAARQRRQRGLEQRHVRSPDGAHRFRTDGRSPIVLAAFLTIIGAGGLVAVAAGLLGIHRWTFGEVLSNLFYLG